MTEQNPAGPTRPFESLDWYRQASRSGSGSLGTGARFLEWARGIGLLSLHVSVFALGIVVMFVINLLRSPDRIWVDRAIPIWTLIVVIHAVLVGLLWAIGQLNREDDGPLLVVSDAKWRSASAWASADPTPPPTESPRSSVPPPHAEAGVETTTHFRPSPAAQTRVQRPVSPPPSEASSQWSGWDSDVVPQQGSSGDGDRASWQEAATAALRGRTAASPPPPSPAAPEGDVPKGS